MKIKISVSNLMSGSTSPLGSNEDRLIRIPSVLRDELNVQVGSFLYLTSKNNFVTPLQIFNAYRKDAVGDSSRAYVSQNTYDELDIKKTNLKIRLQPFEDILIGADPEFFIVDRDNQCRMPASHFFSHTGDVGSDCGLAELRPRPSTDEYTLTSNLYNLLCRANDRIDNRVLFKDKSIDMIAASMFNKAAAGFHIHFGLPSMMLSDIPYFKIIIERIVDVLDYYIGIPSILPEGHEDCERRSGNNSAYGKPGDYRADNLTLEYRVPGGHLLRHPILTAGLFGISIVVIKDILTRFKNYSNGYRSISKLETYNNLTKIYPNLPNKYEVYKSITSDNIDKALSYAPSIIKDISKMIGYKNRKKSIVDYFNYVILNLENKKKFSCDIRENWRIVENEGQ